MSEFIVVFITTPTPIEGEKIASILVEERLASCVNIVNTISSVYRWEGKIEKTNEALLIIKTKAENFTQLMTKVKEVHSYKVPEIIALPIISGNEDYLKWVREETCSF